MYYVMPRLFNLVAVDPGASGGICCVDPAGEITLHPMPESLPDIYKLLAAIRFKDSSMWIEEVPRFAGKNIPSSSTSVLFQNVGRIEGIAFAIGYSLHRVAPTVWQAPLGLGGRKSCENQNEWKRKLKAKAEELFPRVEGITLKTADALLIAHFGMGGGR